MPITAQMHDGTRLEFPDGTDPSVIQATVKNLMAGKPAPAPTEPAKPQRTTIGEIGHQLGLTARAGVGAASDVVGMFSNPIAAALNLASGGINRMAGTKIPEIPFVQQVAERGMDAAGFAKPETAQERVVLGTARTMGTAGGTAGLANIAARSSAPMVQQAGTLLASNPAQQAGAAAGSGYAGSTTREEGGNGVEQFVASLLGGVGGGLAGAAAGNAANRISNAMTPAASSPLTLEVRIERAFRERGADWNALPEAVRASIRRDAEQAMQGGGTLNVDAMTRAADYRAVRGVTPTRGTLTGDPVLLTQEKNLAKTAANMNDPTLQQLPRREFDNNRALVQALNDTSRQPPAALSERAGPIIDSLQQQYRRGQDAIGGLYANARNTEGRYAQLDPAFFNNRVNTLLDESMTGGALPAGVRERINALAQGEHPFDVNYVEQFKTQIGKLQRSASDGQTRMALGQVRQALDETPLVGNQGQDAIDAFNRARMLNRTVEGAIERNPAMAFVRQANRDGVNPAPDAFVEKFILAKGATADNVRTLARSLEGDQAAIDNARAAIVDHLRSKAKIADDGAGNFSAAGFNSELFKLGRAKLSAFFTPEEVEQLHSIGRVARHEVEQPRGSAINNSNSGAMLAGLLAKIGDMPALRAIPMGRQLVAQPAASASVMMGNRSAFNVDGLLRAPVEAGPSGLMTGAPALTAGMLGLLSAQPADERKYR